MRGQKAWYICGYEHMRDDDDRTKASIGEFEISINLPHLPSV